MDGRTRINGVKVVSQFSFRGQILKPFSDKKYVYIPLMIGDMTSPVYYKIPKELFKDESV